jgi:alkanesulfonate monooxygenase SsuD/methylene tetrahydromethanopterin reductase-like flavin-dependent oxidoreductase (luciferase family)
MRFGLFGSAQSSAANLGSGLGQGFHDYIDYNVEAEALGYYSTFLVEHHFTGWSQISATLNLLTWLAARTTTLRVGTAVLVLPWHNPVLLAEQAATLDLLSGGRLDFGIGKGYRHSEFSGFCIPIEDAEARFEEGLEVIMKAWTSADRFSHAGRFWRFEDIIVEPSPCQKPHPAIWMGAGSEPSIQKVADRGFNLLLDQFASAEVIGQRIDLYKKQLARTNGTFHPMNVAVARDVYVAKDRSDKEEALRRHNAMRNRTLEAAKAPGRAGGSHILSYSLSDASTEQNALFGTPDEILEKLSKLEAVGVEYILVNGTGGSRESLRRFAREIMPAFSTVKSTGASLVELNAAVM